MIHKTVAALYVDTARGPYGSLDGVECWGWADKSGEQTDLLAPTRDATQYAGPFTVIAHPPCGPWGRFWWNYKGGEGARECGPKAVDQVREFGGILEHPSASGLWEHCGLPLPGEVDAHGGVTIEVDQCDWGHMARKRTWLYGVGITTWPKMPEPKEPTHVMVRLHRNGCDRPEVPKRLRHLTPPSFARWLLAAVRGGASE